MNQHFNENKKNSQFTKAVLLGALAGAVISLFDKDTRSSVAVNGRSFASGVKTFLLHPDGVLNQVKEATGTMRSTVEKISDDVAFIADKVDEFKEVPSQLVKMVIDTKESFEQDKGSYTSSTDIPQKQTTL